MKYLPKNPTQASFFEAVYAVVRLIPSGRVTTYGAIAQCLGTKGSARMVGWALHQAAQYPEVPAHRVVNRHGLLTGKHHFTGAQTMEQRLAAEGVRVRQDQVQEFAQLFWDPIQGMGVLP
ncbi:MAG: MGMT family protein [Bacteroidota bacterium]